MTDENTKLDVSKIDIKKIREIVKKIPHDSYKLAYKETKPPSDVYFHDIGKRGGTDLIDIKAFGRFDQYAQHNFLLDLDQTVVEKYKNIVKESYGHLVDDEDTE